jgi:hypothetical protein
MIEADPGSAVALAGSNITGVWAERRWEKLTQARAIAKSRVRVRALIKPKKDG